MAGSFVWERQPLPNQCLPLKSRQRATWYWALYYFSISVFATEHSSRDRARPRIGIVVRRCCLALLLAVDLFDYRMRYAFTGSDHTGAVGAEQGVRGSCVDLSSARMPSASFPDQSHARDKSVPESPAAHNRLRPGLEIPNTRLRCVSTPL